MFLDKATVKKNKYLIIIGFLFFIFLCIFAPGLIFFYAPFMLLIYWFIRGFVRLTQRHHPILVVAYVIFIPLWSYIHCMIVGVWGSSQKKIEDTDLLKEAKKKVKFDRLVEEEEKKSSK